MRRQSGFERIKAMMLLQMQGRPLDVNSLMQLMLDRDPQVRAQAVYLIGVNNDRDAHLALAAALKDDDPLVRRRACEALIRCNLAAPLANLWPLLGDPDRFVRTAARLCLQRLSVKDWTRRLWTEENDLIFLEGVVALCKTDQAAPFEEPIFDHLHKGVPEAPEAQLQYLRPRCNWRCCTRPRTNGPAACAASRWSARSCSRRRTGASTVSWPWC